MRFRAGWPPRLHDSWRQLGLCRYTGGVTTNYDSDPCHYSFEELTWMAGPAGLEAELIGEWDYPRNHGMTAFPSHAMKSG